MLRQCAGRRCWARRCAMRWAEVLGAPLRQCAGRAIVRWMRKKMVARFTSAPMRRVHRAMINPALQQRFCPPASLVLHAVLVAKTMQNLAHERAVVLLGVAPQTVAALVLDARRLAELRRPLPGLLKNVIVSAGRREGGWEAGEGPWEQGGAQGEPRGSSGWSSGWGSGEGQGGLRGPARGCVPTERRLWGQRGSRGALIRGGALGAPRGGAQKNPGGAQGELRVGREGPRDVPKEGTVGARGVPKWSPGKAHGDLRGSPRGDAQKPLTQ